MFEFLALANGLFANGLLVGLANGLAHLLGANGL